MYVFNLVSIAFVLIGLPKASPDEDLWVQGTGLYVGGSKDAFSAQYPYPTISIVCLYLLSRDTLADFAHRPSSSSLSELVSRL